MRKGKPILMVDDDRIDILSVRRAFAELAVSNRLDEAGNGEEALALLQDPKTASPCLILLDLSMPRMDGFEFLRVIKNDRKYGKIPVIVLTTSQEEQDIIDSFRLGVAGYMVKPHDYKQLVEVVRTIEAYWKCSELP